MKLFLSLTFIFLIHSCQEKYLFTPNDLVMDENISLKESTLSAEQLEYDLSLLQYAFKRAYGGRKFIDSSIMNKVNEQLGQLKKDRSIKKSSDLGEKLGELLNSIPDNHLLVLLDGQLQGKSKQELFHGTRTGQVGYNILHGTQRVWGIEYRKAGNKSVPIISIYKLPGGQDKVWNGFLDKVFEIKKKVKSGQYPAIIIDLRGNEGGADTMGTNMAAYLYGQDPPSPLEKAITSQTAETLALRINYKLIDLIYLKRKGEVPPTYLLDDLNNAKSLFHKSLLGKVPEEIERKPYAGNPYEPQKSIACPIYLLIDRGCASSCEDIVDHFEGYPKSILVGQNTGGFIHFGNVGYLVLPHSKLMIQMATDYWQYKDKRFIEFIGIKPNIEVKSGEDALEIALANILTLQK